MLGACSTTPSPDLIERRTMQHALQLRADALAGHLVRQRLAHLQRHADREQGRAGGEPFNQSITFKIHGEPAEVSWDWAGGEGCVSGVHSIGRGTVRCGRRLAGPARPVGWTLRAGISVRSGCGGGLHRRLAAAHDGSGGPKPSHLLGRLCLGGVIS